MTLKQRRRHGEILARIDQLKRGAYAKPPQGYEFGINPEEDAKYMEVLEAVAALVEEAYEIEAAARARD